MRTTIVIPCYNGEQFLLQTLKSIEAQTHKPNEILLIDDGSTDNSISIAEEFDVNVHRNPKNMGIGYTRQVGLDIADGDYVAYLSADDVYHPKFLETSLKNMKKNKGTYTDYYICDKNLIPTSLFQCPNYSRENVINWALKKNTFVNFSSILIPKDIPVKFIKELKKGEDTIFLLDSIISGFEWKRIQEPLLYYRIHKTQGSARWNKEEFLLSYKYLIDRLEKLGVDKNKIIRSYYRGRILSVFLIYYIKLPTRLRVIVKILRDNLANDDSKSIKNSNRD